MACPWLCLDASNYKYQWSLDSHPDGDETGEMADIDSSSLKLSKVSDLLLSKLCLHCISYVTLLTMQYALFSVSLTLP